MKQGEEYREGGRGLERISRLLLDLNVNHPMPVRRIHELTAWVASGDYDRIIGGSYIHRDEPARPRADASDAVAHYAERFKNVFRDAGESINDVGQAGQRLAAWQRRGKLGGVQGRSAVRRALLSGVRCRPHPGRPPPAELDARSILTGEGGAPRRRGRHSGRSIDRGSLTCARRNRS